MREPDVDYGSWKVGDEWVFTEGATGGVFGWTAHSGLRVRICGWHNIHVVEVVEVGGTVKLSLHRGTLASKAFPISPLQRLAEAAQ